MSALETLAAIERERLIMVVRGRSAEDAWDAIRLAVDSGVRVVEVTFTVPDALELIRRLSRERADVLVGAGTVLTTDAAADAVAAGARFVVSPGLDERVLRFARERDLLMMPGILTPSEAMRAVDAGAHVVKLFPADAVGASYLAALRAPLAGLKVIPSGGVRSVNAGDWIAAGAVAVGMGGALSPSGPIDEEAAAALRAEAVAALAALFPERSSTTHIPDTRTPPRTSGPDTTDTYTTDKGTA